MNQPFNPNGPQGPGQPQWQGQQPMPGQQPPVQGQQPWQGQPHAPMPGQLAAGPYPGQPGPAVKKKSKTTLIVAAVLALVLIAGGAIAAVTLLKKPANIAAATVLPDNPLAVLSFDLNPDAKDQLAVKELVDKFPSLTEGLEMTEGNYKKALVDFAAQNGSGIEWSEVEAWLGDSVTVGLYPGDPADPFSPQVQITAVHQKDAAKAEEFAKTKVSDPSQYRIVDDHLVISSQPLPDAESVKKAPLSENAGFKADLGKLSGSFLVTAWVSDSGVTQLAEQSGQMVPEGTGQMHFAAGLRVEDSTIVLDGVGWQSEKLLEKGEAVDDLVGGLPGDAMGAVGIGASDAAIERLWEQLSARPDAQPALEAFGVTSKEDLAALVGNQFALHAPGSLADAISGSASQASFGIVVKTKDVAKHEALLDKVKAQVPQGLTSKTEGDKVYTTWNGSPEDLIKPKSRLADDETYKRVIKDAGGATGIVYVNLGDVLESVPGATEGPQGAEIRKLDGLGMVMKQLDDHYAGFTVRLAIK